MARMTVYDMIRAKAKDMGYNASQIPDKLYEKQVEFDSRQMNLLGAKLYLENYMMGNVSANDFASVLAANDELRYTVSDLCRMKLEPRELNVQRNNNYIDIGAGVKTFWSEMRVPLPSEKEAARDLRNIALGVEAGKRSRDTAATQDAVTAQESPEQAPAEKKRSFREILDSAKQRAASAAIEKLKPIAEGTAKDEKQAEKLVDEGWLETEDGQAYKEAYTRRAAQQVENVVMDIEAGKSIDMEPEERKKALEAAGMNEENARDFVEGQAQEEKPINRTEFRSGYSEAELSSPTGDQMEALMKQISRHMGQDVEKAAPKQDKGQDRKPHRQRDDRFYGQFEGKDVSFKKKWSTHEFTEDEARKLLSGEAVSFEYEKDGKTRTANGRLEWQEYEGRPFLGFKPDYSKKQEAPAGEKADELFTADDEAAMDYYSGAGDEDMDAYYARMARDMEEYQPDEPPVPPAESEEGPPELSAQDIAGLFDDGQDAIKL